MEYAIASNLTINRRLHLGGDIRLRHSGLQILKESSQTHVRNPVCLPDCDDFFWSFS
jgi:hypothetical protein